MSCPESGDVLAVTEKDSEGERERERERMEAALFSFDSKIVKCSSVISAN